MIDTQRTPLHRRVTLRPIAPLALVVLVVLSAMACTGKKKPEVVASQTTTQVSPQLEPPPQLPPPIRQVRPTRPSTVTVIDPGGSEQEPQTLYEASEYAKTLKRAGATPEPVAEINDDNLHEYAEQADIIMLEGEPAAPALTMTQDREPNSLAPDAELGEEYWRNGALELRMGWRRTIDRIEELELESASLRQQFYAEEDTYIRDSHIKPDWDRVLDRLSQLRDRSRRYEQELEQFLEDGHRGGALPGWLSEGWELEPERDELADEEADAFAAHQAGEPQVVEEVIDP